MAAVTNTLLLLALIVTVLISVAKTSSASRGFSIDLLHRDSPNSPLYNPHETRAQRLENAAKRSLRGARHRLDIIRSARLDDVEAPLTPDTAEYLVKISLGTPSFPIFAVADTGSDIIWTQCKPCSNCYDQIAPLFDPKKSTTYKEVACSSSVCSELAGEGSTCTNGSPCEYRVGYGDQSHTIGDLATDTLTLNSTSGRPVALPKMIIGCGHDNSGTFSNTTSGIVGLGGGPASLVSQLGSTISGKFSYCMPPFGTNKPSTLSFGQNAVVSNGVSTPILSDESQPTFYYLQLDAISVGTTRVPFNNGGAKSSSPSSAANQQGNIIIDSGTTLTFVPSTVLSQLSDAITSQVTGGTATQVDDLGPCYKDDGSLKVPNVTMHFDGGDVELTQANTFLEVAEGVYCFAFAGSNSLPIYGNVAQQNFLVGYDVKEGSVTFKPTDCTGGSD
ncbi:Aspartic proteinase CDR1 [Linum grandiflorum]